MQTCIYWRLSAAQGWALWPTPCQESYWVLRTRLSGSQWPSVSGCALLLWYSRCKLPPAPVSTPDPAPDPAPVPAPAPAPAPDSLLGVPRPSRQPGLPHPLSSPHRHPRHGSIFCLLVRQCFYTLISLLLLLLWYSCTLCPKVPPWNP